MVVALVLAMALQGCGQAPSDPPPSNEGVPAGSFSSPIAVGPTADPGSAPEATPPGDVPAGIVELSPLPEPTLDDPFAIGEALYDPGRMDVGVVSLLHLMGVGIYELDGTPIRAGDERDETDLRLTEPEVRGLIAEGIEDLTSDPDAELPYTFRDFHAGMAPFMPGVSADDLARVFADAYEAHPDELVPQVMLGQPIEPETPITRVHWWLLFADGFVEPSIPATASLGADGSTQRAGSSRWGTARTASQLVTLPPAGMSARDFLLLVERLQTAGHGANLSVLANPNTTHEGHGGSGRSISLFGGIGDLANPAASISGLSGLSGLPVRPMMRPAFTITLDSSDRAAWYEHGSLAVGFGRAQSNAGIGVVRDTYTPKREAGDGRGVYVGELLYVYARAKKAEVVASAFDIPIDRSLLAALFPGDIVSPETPVNVDWHARDGLQLMLENHYDVALGIRDTVVLGDASAEGLEQVQGFLPRQSDGTWRGIIQASGHVTAHCDFLGQPIVETLDARQDILVYGTASPAPRSRSPLDVLEIGAFGDEDVHLTFYPAGPPRASDGDCLDPVFNPVGGGPLGRRNLTYMWFNDARITDPTRGYTINVADSGTLMYRDNLFAAGNNGLEGADSWWQVSVTRVEP